MEERELMKNKIIAFGIASCLSLAGCKSGGNSSNKNSDTNEETINKQESAVFLDTMGVIPVSNKYQATSFIIRLNNHSAEKYFLEKTQLTDLANPDTASTKLMNVSVSLCEKLGANSSCSIQLTPKIAQPADLLLSVDLKDEKGNLRHLQQIIRTDNHLIASNSNGLVMGSDIGASISNHNGYYGLSIPVVLTRDFDKVEALNGRLLCNGSSYTAGSSCSYLVSSVENGQNSALLHLRLSGYKAGSEPSVNSANLIVAGKKTQANLVMSYNTEVKAGQSTKVYIFNNGNYAAEIKDIKFADDSLFEIGADSTCLNKTLEVGTTSLNSPTGKLNSCYVSIKAKADQTKSTSEMLSIMYSRNVNAETAIAQARVIYLADTPSEIIAPQIEITDDGSSLENVATNAQKVVTLTNKGKKTLSSLGLSFNNVIPGLSIVSSAIYPDANSCINAGFLKPEDVCKFTVSYIVTATPKRSSGGANLAHINITGVYINEDNISQQYIKTHDVSYSKATALENYLMFASSANDDTMLDYPSPPGTNFLYNIIKPSGIANFGNKVKTLSFYLKVANADAAKITIEDFAIVDKDANPIPDLVISKTVGRDSCTDGLNFADIPDKPNFPSPPNKICALNVDYFPTQELSPTDAYLKIKYKNIETQKSYEKINEFTVMAVEGAANIEATMKVVNPNTEESEVGTSMDNPYKVILGSKPLVFEYILTNTGVDVATGIMFDASFLPFGVKVISKPDNYVSTAANSCYNNQAINNGIYTTSLGGIPATIGEVVDSRLGISCSIYLEVFPVAYSKLVDADKGTISFPVNYSYIDTKGFHHQRVLTRYLDFTRNWASYQVNDSVSVNNNGGWDVVLSTSINSAASIKYPLTISWSAPFALALELVSFSDLTCTIVDSANPKCDVSIHFNNKNSPGSRMLNLKLTDADGKEMNSISVIELPGRTNKY